MQVGGAPASSPSRQVGAGEAIVVAGPARRFVSRGGHKLEAALDAFGIDVTGRRALDAGASTGGFTDCLLQRGAASVVAVDVGRGQISWGLRHDPRVTVMERTNIRDVGVAEVGGPFDVVTADLAFISLRLVAPVLAELSAPSGSVVALVKPQFEAGRGRVGRGGVVRDPATWRAAVAGVVSSFGARGLAVVGGIVSPLRGADGNVEFLLHAVGGGDPEADAIVDALDAPDAPDALVERLVVAADQPADQPADRVP